MKKFLTVLLILVMVFTFAAFGMPFSFSIRVTAATPKSASTTSPITTNPKMVLIRSPW